MNRLKFTIVFTILSIFVIESYSQTTSQKIKIIREEFQKINNDSSLKKKTIDDPEEFLGHNTDGGGELTGYFNGDTLCKIYLSVGLSYGDLTN